MDKTPHLIPNEKTNAEKRDMILENIVKMLTYRNWLKKEKLEENLKKIVSHHPDDFTYIIKLDKNEEYLIKFIPQTITAINKSSGIEDFLKRVNTKHGALVIPAINNKPKTQIKRNYPQVEIWLENEIKIDYSIVDVIPYHEKYIDAKDEEKFTKFLKAYNTKSKHHLPKIKDGDMMAKYLALKPGDLCKIIRPSEGSMKINYYRFCVPGVAIK